VSSDHKARTPHRSLRLKWTGALLLIGGLPLLCLAVATLRIQRAGLEVAERSLQVAVIEQVDGAIDRQLDDVVERTHRVGQLLRETAITEPEARIRMARDLVGRAAVIDEIAVFDGDGAWRDAIVREGAASPAIAHDALRVSCEEDAGGRWLAPLRTPNGAVLRYREALLQEGRCAAWIIASLTPGVLDRRVGDLSEAAFAQRNRVLVLDEQQRVLAGDASIVDRDHRYVDGELFSRPLPAGAFNASFGLTSEYRGADGVPMIGTLRASPDRGWGTLVRRPQAEAYAALTRASRALVATTGGFLLLALLAGAALAARTTRPIVELVALTRSYAQRDFKRRSRISSGDELELLGESMGKMADDLSASETEIARRAVVEGNFARYLPAELALAIAEGRADLSLGGQRRDVSVLFADVVAFTSFAEDQEPEHVVAFLNELFTVLSEVVFRHGGTIDKFIGDCVMAIFGAPSPLGDHARRAVAAAEDMQRFVEATAPTWRERYGVIVKLAIGINSGPALVGNLGSESRMEYTAIGDTVNVAARLESIARGNQTLVTRAVVERAGGEFSFESLGTHPLHGKAQSVEVFELR
jgi:adenylate cyclase